MTAYSPEAWEAYFLANAGAAAALAGLLFVGISINVRQIVESGRLTGRALEAFALLGGVLIASVLVAVPAITREALGVTLLIVGIALWLTVSAQHARSIGQRDPAAPPGSVLVRITLGQASTLPVIVAALSLLADGGGGLYWLVAAVVVSYIAALVDAWVLLIEILR